MSYTVLHQAKAPHVCDLPPVGDFYPGTVVECDDCGRSYTLVSSTLKGGELGWSLRRDVPPKPVER